MLSRIAILMSGAARNPVLSLNFLEMTTLDQLIDFTRTSAATYVDATGKIVSTPASRNLLTFTQEFDNAAWAKAGVTVTPNAALAPDNTVSADAIIPNLGSTTSSASQTISASAVTGSVFAKAAGFKALELDFAVAGARVEFDLQNGVVASAPANWTCSISSVGNGWYRCVAKPDIAVTRMRVYVKETGDGTSGIFVWGAQLEAGSTATDYTRNFGGVYPPRFDYDPVTLAPKGLLIEEQRTNLLLRSEDFTTSWGAVSTTVTANTTVAPDGTTTADTLTAATTGAYVQQNVTFTGDGDKAYSVFLKAGTSTTTRLTLRDTTATVNRGSVDITWTAGVPSGVATFGTLQGIDSFGNGWYRVRMLATGVVAANTNQFRFSPDPIASTGTSIMWGAQTENGSFATSYIPTVASQVTRTADVATITGANFSQWYNQTEGTFVVGYGQATGTTPRALVVANDGTNNNNVGLYADGSNDLNNQPAVAVVTSSVSQVNINMPAVAQNATHKMAFSYKTDDFAVSVDGGAVLTDTSGTVPTVNRLDIGNRISTLFNNGHIRSIQYYNTRLPNAQLQALTA